MLQEEMEASTQINALGMWIAQYFHSYAVHVSITWDTETMLFS